jgi:hypothetical protein
MSGLNSTISKLLLVTFTADRLGLQNWFPTLRPESVRSTLQSPAWVACGLLMAPHRYLLWRAPFPPKIQSKLVTNKNLKGQLTISDFELASIIAHQDILVQSVDACECTFSPLKDHSPAVSRVSKGSIT